MIKNEIGELQKISDEELKLEIKEYLSQIPEETFINGFACYGITKRLFTMSRDDLVDEKTKNIPKEEIENILARATLIFRFYISFVYLRSAILEEKIKKVPDNSKLSHFKKLFAKGSRKKGTDTNAQHIRNSISHGTFEIQKGIIVFKDRGRTKSFTFKELDEMCGQILRFYFLAFEVVNNIKNKH